MINKQIPKLILASSIVLLPLFSMSAANANSNVKPIPTNFSGKWAGLHSTKQKLNKAVLKDLCDNGGEQDTSFFVTFNEDRQRMTNVAYWEDMSTEYPVSYSKYTPNHIAGQSLSLSFEMGDEDTLANKTVTKFDYKIVSGKLYIGTPTDTIEMMRCV